MCKENACEEFKFPTDMSQPQSIQIEVTRRVVKYGNLPLTKQTFTSHDVSIYLISVP